MKNTLLFRFDIVMKCDTINCRCCESKSNSTVTANRVPAISIRYVRLYHNNTIKYPWYYMNGGNLLSTCKTIETTAIKIDQKQSVCECAAVVVFLLLFLLFSSLLISSSFIFHEAQRLHHIMCVFHFCTSKCVCLVHCAGDMIINS